MRKDEPWHSFYLRQNFVGISSFIDSIRKTLTFILFLAVLSIFSNNALAEYPEAKNYFESLEKDSQISITLGLIGTGDFDGLYGYGFTKRMYRAVNAFKAREGLTANGLLAKAEIELLTRRATQFFGSLGLKTYSHPVTHSQLFIPRSIFDTEITTSRGFAFERYDKNISLSFDLYPPNDKSFVDLYNSAARVSLRRHVRYKTIHNNFFVVNGTYNGRFFYTWMTASRDGTSGFTLSWSPGWATTGKKISILLANSYLPDAKIPEPDISSPHDNQQNSTGNTMKENPPSSGTGTGFKVTDEGHVLTNFHVAGRCQKVFLSKPGEISVAAQVVAVDETNDLALLKADRLIGGTTAKFNASQPKAGSDIVVYGFPLTGMLSTSGNVVIGNITALAGLGNDSRLFQISAPVQPGNSGGPVIDRYGNVVAVIVSKLNVMAMSKVTGDISQNVNFAIKGNIATNFMEGVGVKFQTETSTGSFDTPTLGEKAQGFTYLVECQN